MILALVLAALVLWGCGQKSRAPGVLSRISPPVRGEPLEGLGADSLKAAIGQSLRYLKRLPPERRIGLGRDWTTAQGLTDSLEQTLRLLDRYGLGPRFHQALRDEFVFYAASDSVLFTGYYEPLLEGTETKDEVHTTPLLGRPKDLIGLNLKDFGMDSRIIRGRLDGQRLVPYHTREQIDQGALEGRAPVLAWVDPVEAFFLQIQGSGRVRLPDGRQILVNYADQNGHPYVSLGRYMIDQGLMEKKDVSLQSLKDYLRAHPQEAPGLLAQNPSYVFFRTVDEGPLGCLGVPLTPGRSLALDRRVYPDACLGLIRVNLPLIEEGRITGWEERLRLVLIQDTGGAIRGASRADIFFGYGDEAELGAGNMKETGRLFILVHKGAVTAGQD